METLKKSNNIIEGFSNEALILFTIYFILLLFSINFIVKYFKKPNQNRRRIILNPNEIINNNNNNNVNNNNNNEYEENYNINTCSICLCNILLETCCSCNHLFCGFLIYYSKINSI